MTMMGGGSTKTAVPRTTLKVVTGLLAAKVPAGAAAGSSLQRLASLAVSMKIHCRSSLKLARLISCWSAAGGVGAHPLQSPPPRQITQAGLHCAPGIQTQPLLPSDAQRP